MGIFDAFKKSAPEPEPEGTPTEFVIPPPPEPEPPEEPEPMPEPEPTPPPSIPQPPTSSELPPGHQGEPTAAASSSTGIGAEEKTTEPVVPVFNPDEVEPLPKSFIDTQVEVTEKAQQLEEDRGDQASEEVKAAEQTETFESKLEKGAE